MKKVFTVVGARPLDTGHPRQQPRQGREVPTVFEQDRAVAQLGAEVLRICLAKCVECVGMGCEVIRQSVPIQIGGQKLLCHG